MSKISTAINLIKSNKGAFFANTVKNFLPFLPDRVYLQLLYRFKVGRKLNLNQPKSFTEKLQWLKLYDRNPHYTSLVDKVAVKSFVAKEIGSQYVIPIIKTWDDLNDFELASMPDSFVLKTTNGSGGDGVYICPDKNQFCFDKASSILNKSIKSNVYRNLREWPYKNIVPRFFAEQYLEDDSGALRDYKVMCFNGVPKLIQVHMGRYDGVHTQDFYSTEWERLDLNQKNCVVSNNPTECPHCLEEMLRLSKALSTGIPHVRVDWYVVNDRLYFGEFTFFDASGFDEFIPMDKEYEIGGWIDLSSIE